MYIKKVKYRKTDQKVLKNDDKNTVWYIRNFMSQKTQLFTYLQPSLFTTKLFLTVASISFQSNYPELALQINLPVYKKYWVNFKL